MSWGGNYHHHQPQTHFSFSTAVNGNSRRKASTLASWSNLPGKAMLIDQLAKLKARSSAPSSCNKCKCCQANGNTSNWEEAFYVQQPQPHPQFSSATLKPQQKKVVLKKGNNTKSSDWLNNMDQQKSVRFRLPVSQTSPPPFQRQPPPIFFEPPRSRRSHSYFHEEEVFRTLEAPPDNGKSSVIVKSPHTATAFAGPPKKSKSLFSHRFLGSEKPKKSPQSEKPISEAANENGNNSPKNSSSVESDPGYESDPANSAAAAAAALLALQEACSESDQQKSATLPKSTSEKKSMFLLKKFSPNKSEESNNDNSAPPSLPVTMRVFSPVRVSKKNSCISQFEMSSIRSHGSSSSNA